MSEIKMNDAIIIGSGQAGNPLMHDLSKRGQKIAMIEKNKLGGSCINFGFYEGNYKQGRPHYFGCSYTWISRWRNYGYDTDSNDGRNEI